MKKSLILIVAIVCFLAGLCVATCPNRQAHKDAITEKANTAVNNALNETLKGESAGLSFVGSLIGGVLSSKIIDTALDSKIQYDNYFVCSTSSFDLKGEKKIVSVGVMGHVFVLFGKDDISKTINGLLK